MKPKLFSLNLLRLGLLCALLQPLQAASFTQETDVEYLASGDFNGDGRLDVLVVDRDTGVVRVMNADADNQLSDQGSIASGITGPSFVSVGRLGDGSSALPGNDRLLIGSPDANRAAIVNPRFPISTPRAVHQLGIAPEAAAVVQFPASVSGNTEHEDIVSWTAQAAAGSTALPGGALRDFLNKGNSLTRLSQVNDNGPLRSLNAVQLEKGSGWRVAGLRRVISDLGGGSSSDADSLVLFSPGALSSPAMSLDLGLSNARYVVGVFGQDTTASFVAYTPGDSQLAVVLVKKTGSQFSFVEPLSPVAVNGPVKSLCVLGEREGAQSLAVAYQDGSVDILSLEAGQLLAAQPISSADLPEGGVSALVAGPNGHLHLMESDSEGRSKGARTLKQDADGNWNALSTGSRPLAPVSKVADLANVLLFDKQPFLNAGVRMLGSYRAGDWTQRLSFSGTGAAVTASATVERFRDTASGLGSSSVVALGSVAGLSAGLPGQLVNQYADNVSIFSLESASGELVDVVSAAPPSGAYPGQVRVTLTAAGGSNIFWRQDPSQPFRPYTAALELLQSSTLEYYAEHATTGRRSAIARSNYELPEDLARADSDGDGLPDFVERAFGLDPTLGSDSDGDGVSDLHELLAGTLGPDSDGDGVSDLVEGFAGTDPNDAGEKPELAEILPNLTQFELALTPSNGLTDPSRAVAAEGSPVTAHGLSGMFLGSARVGTQSWSGLPLAADLRVTLPAKLPPVVALGTGPNFALEDGSGTLSTGPYSAELVGLVQMPVMHLPIPDFDLGAAPSTPAEWLAEAQRWITEYRTAWQALQSMSRVIHEITPADTLALLIVEAKVTEVMRARGMISPSQRANLTPWRPRLDASLVTPTAAQWQALERSPNPTDKALRPADCLQQVLQLFNSFEGDERELALRAVVEGIYDIASRRDQLEPLVGKGSIGSPVDILRQMMAKAQAADSSDLLPSGITGLLGRDSRADVVIASADAAATALAELLGMLSERNHEQFTLEVPGEVALEAVAGWGGVFLIDPSTEQLYQLLDAQGRDYEVTKGLRLPVGASFEVRAFTDLVPAGSISNAPFIPIEVVSMKWLSVPELVDEMSPPVITELTATVESTGESLDTNRPLQVPEADAVTLSVSFEGDLTDLTYQWRRNGVPIVDEEADSLRLDSTAASFPGFYDVVITTASGRSVSRALETRVLVIKPVVELVEVSLSGESIEDGNVLAQVNEALEIRVQAVTAAFGLRYEWLRNGSKIAGADPEMDTLSLDAVQFPEAGTYSLRLVPINEDGKALTPTTVVQLAELAVYQFPPTSNIVLKKVGETAEFAALASGRGLSFQWMRRGGIIAADGRATGLTSNNFKLAKLMGSDNGYYVCRVQMGTQVREVAEYNLTVLTPPQILGVLPLAMPPAVVRGAYSWTVPTSIPPSNNNPIRFSASGLPAGLAINQSTGVISGRITATAANFSPKISASNEYGTTTVGASLEVRPLRADLLGDYVALLGRHELNAQSGGMLSLGLSSGGVASGRLVLGGQTISFTSEIETADGSRATASVEIRSSTRQLLAMLNFALDAEAASISGSLTPVAQELSKLEFLGWSNYWSRAGRVGSNPYTGRQHWLMRQIAAGANSPQVKLPAGYGYSAAVVRDDGSFTIAGSTGDGQTLTQTGFIGRQGQVGVFQLLYSTRTKGSILGRVNLADNSESSLIQGILTWNRPTNLSTIGAPYPDGFSPVALLAEGGKYTAPAPGTRILGLGAQNQAQLSAACEDAGIALGPVATFLLSATNGFTLAPAGLSAPYSAATASVAAATGIVKGSFTRRDPNPSVSGTPIVRTVNFDSLIVPIAGTMRAYGQFEVNEMPSLSRITRAYRGSVLLEPPPLR